MVPLPANTGTLSPSPPPPLSPTCISPLPIISPLISLSYCYGTPTSQHRYPPPPSPPYLYISPYIPLTSPFSYLFSRFCSLPFSSLNFSHLSPLLSSSFSLPVADVVKTAMKYYIDAIPPIPPIPTLLSPLSPPLLPSPLSSSSYLFFRPFTVLADVVKTAMKYYIDAMGDDESKQSVRPPASPSNPVPYACMPYASLT